MIDSRLIRKQRLAAHDPYAIGDFVRDLLVSGVRQLTIAEEAGDIVVSWPALAEPLEDQPMPA